MSNLDVDVRHFLLAQVCSVSAEMERFKTVMTTVNIDFILGTKSY